MKGPQFGSFQMGVVHTDLIFTIQRGIAFVRIGRTLRMEQKYEIGDMVLINGESIISNRPTIVKIVGFLNSEMMKVFPLEELSGDIKTSSEKPYYVLIERIIRKISNDEELIGFWLARS
ncbi:Uncharacterised protein [uncultured archaeon]|nr:Uncharacterised protein [uncultured archaeon]